VETKLTDWSVNKIHAGQGVKEKMAPPSSAAVQSVAVQSAAWQKYDKMGYT